MQCDYFDAGLCLSCTLMGQPYSEQLAAKEARVRELLAPFAAGAQWLPPIASDESGFRAKAKMVVGGTLDQPTLGILDGAQRGVDLRHCGIIDPRILAAFPALIEATTRMGLEPYDVPARQGELKHLIVTVAASGDLMVRFVVRSEDSMASIRSHLTWLTDAVPQLAVVTANIHPKHKAVLEGEVEHVLTSQSVLRMQVGDVELLVRPQSFVQTNTAIAAALYRQAAAWLDELGAESVWDLYCGVGGFALSCASPAGDATDRARVPRRATRSILGVESSADAVASAELGRDALFADASERQSIRFIAADATAFALGPTADAAPDVIIVNPPRRGLGVDLATWLQASGPRHVIYSSCNPESLARDLAAMPDYRVTRARVLDMFPQSTHLEAITLLERA